MTAVKIFGSNLPPARLLQWFQLNKRTLIQTTGRKCVLFPRRSWSNHQPYSSVQKDFFSKAVKTVQKCLKVLLIKHWLDNGLFAQMSEYDRSYICKKNRIVSYGVSCPVKAYQGILNCTLLFILQSAGRQGSYYRPSPFSLPSQNKHNKLFFFWTNLFETV